MEFSLKAMVQNFQTNQISPKLTNHSLVCGTKTICTIWDTHNYKIFRRHNSLGSTKVVASPSSHQRDRLRNSRNVKFQLWQGLWLYKCYLNGGMKQETIPSIWYIVNVAVVCDWCYLDQLYSELHITHTYISQRSGPMSLTNVLPYTYIEYTGRADWQTLSMLFL